MDAHTKVLGLIGQGIGHSLSPRIHNFAAQKLAKNQVYLPFDLEASHLQSFLDVMWAVGAVGFNITLPYKQALLPYVETSGCHSINTLYRGPQGWRGCSTDAEGLFRGILQLGKQRQDFNRYVILGSGGVVAGLVEYLTAQTTQEIEIAVLRRRADVDAQLQALVADQQQVTLECFDFSLSGLGVALKRGSTDTTLLIQATSAPLKGERLEALVPALSGFQGAVVDLVYGVRSAILEWAESAQLPCQDGLPMLIEQARLAQQLWWGEAVTYEALEQHLGAQ